MASKAANQSSASISFSSSSGICISSMVLHKFLTSPINRQGELYPSTSPPPRLYSPRLIYTPDT
jgi:hypothetical protein